MGRFLNILVLDLFFAHPQQELCGFNHHNIMLMRWSSACAPTKYSLSDIHPPRRVYKSLDWRDVDATSASSLSICLWLSVDEEIVNLILSFAELLVPSVRSSLLLLLILMDHLMAGYIIITPPIFCRSRCDDGVPHIYDPKKKPMKRAGLSQF